MRTSGGPRDLAAGSGCSRTCPHSSSRRSRSVLRADTGIELDRYGCNGLGWSDLRPDRALPAADARAGSRAARRGESSGSPHGFQETPDTSGVPDAVF